MTTHPFRFVIAVAFLSFGLAGCGFEHESNSPLGPTTQGGSLAGTWTSGAITVPDANSCTNFQWNVNDVNGSTVSGQFSATCAGNLQVIGTGTGTMTTTNLTWAANGTATQGSSTCGFGLSGTAVPQNGSNLRIEYAGTVCGIAVSGTQILNKN